jgi:hypothetical protein
MTTSNRAPTDAAAPMIGYDVIGDVHGHANALTALLRTMDYVERDGVWAHDERQAIFVGDLIDRGPQQIESVRIARTMVEAGSAQIVLGNHEFNAVAYATPDGQGDYLRPHLGDDDRCRKNREQHEKFIGEVGFRTQEHIDMIEWFKTIPLWLDLGGLRVVHACWSSDHIDYLRPLVGENDNLTDDLVVTSSDEDDPSYDAVETILKGPEIPLGNLHYLDKDGHVRDRARIAWWKEAGQGRVDTGADPEWHRISLRRRHAAPLPDETTPENERFVYGSDIPVVFGHYWWSASGASPAIEPCASTSASPRRANSSPTDGMGRRRSRSRRSFGQPDDESGCGPQVRQRR